MSSAPMDNRDMPIERLTVGGLTLRQDTARLIFLELMRRGSGPKGSRQEDIDKWAETHAVAALTATDTLFDFLYAPERGDAVLRRKVRDGE